MHLGVSFPQTEIGADPVAIRDFAQTVEGAGFDYLATFEHVAGAHPDRFAGADLGFPTPPYLYQHQFHEPFALFSYIAALTSRVELVTNVLVLPQRQTVLVAKQAAEVALLSGGRLRLGVGVGWNFAEYESLGADFHTRGRREEEQIEVLRKLWTEPLVSFEGRWHSLDRIGIAPLPPRPIPIWLGGGTSELLLSRVARLADGWMPILPLAQAEDVLTRLRGHLRKAGRDQASVGLQASVSAAGDTREWVDVARRWQALGATHLTVGGGQGLPPMRALQVAIEGRKVLAGLLGG